MTRAAMRKRLTKVIRDLEEVEREVAVFTEPSKLDLVGVGEAAEILGIASTTVSQRRRNGHMPEPIAVLKCGPIWHRGDIEAVA